MFYDKLKELNFCCDIHRKREKNLVRRSSKRQSLGRLSSTFTCGTLGLSIENKKTIPLKKLLKILKLQHMWCKRELELLWFKYPSQFYLHKKVFLIHLKIKFLFLYILQRVGCDLKIGSAKKVDACGVCGGDGNSCTQPLYNWEIAPMSLCSVTCGGGKPK